MGSFIGHFDITPVKACPGRSSICERFCYCLHGRFATRRVKRRLEWCYRQALSPDFVPRMIEEVRHRGVLVFRWHVAGDIFSPSYAEKMLEVMRACDKVRYYLYSRSYRIPTILPLLAQMAALPQCQVWFSCDAETGEPETVPAGVKLCYMQHASTAIPVKSELVFRTRNMRKQPKVSLPMVCPQEDDKDVTCGSCQYCFRE